MYRKFSLCISLCLFSFLSLAGQDAKGMKKGEASQDSEDKKERRTPSVSPQIDTFQPPDTSDFYISNISSWTPISFPLAWNPSSTGIISIDQCTLIGIYLPSSPMTIPITARHSGEDLSGLTSFELNRKHLNEIKELLSLFDATLFPQGAEKTAKEDHEQEEPPQQTPEKSD